MKMRRESLSFTFLWLVGLISLGGATVAFRSIGREVTAVGCENVAWLAMVSGAITVLLPRFATSWLRRPGEFLVGCSLFALISMAGATWSYFAASQSIGYADRQMIAFDALLGLRWDALYRWELAHPALIPAARLVYVTLGFTPVAVLAALAFSGRSDRLRSFLTVHFVALAMTVSLFALLPVRSPLLAFLPGTPSYMPAAGISHVAVIDALRDGSFHTINVGALQGIIGFPSFHTAASIVFIWAVWPMRRVRVPVTALCVAVIATTPVEGVHYVADVVGGALVAWAAIAGVAFTTRLAARPSIVVIQPRPALDQAASSTT